MPLCASKQCSWENKWGSHQLLSKETQYQ
ncbi:hypothetical protein Goklo_001243 [Gossypium klotzschianum]|uniref:Uncharacterized protein n=1 Tax=Gossypium klotzschianum TaxID=34286 RepID=A0A7J8VZU0_9ROSI|nr:hypothetical protein [Gossypium klotzschianum]